MNPGSGALLGPVASGKRPEMKQMAQQLAGRPGSTQKLGPVFEVD